MESKKLVIELFKSNVWANDIIQEVFKQHDISMQQFNVLRILRGQKGNPANLSDIQERMISKMSNTTRLVDKLIAKGLTSRITCPNNRRKVNITITKKGLALLDVIDPILDKHEKEMTDALTKEEKIKLTSLLLKMKKND
ncbi:MarR family transcriptional regulator [Croceibacter atlanticus]|uniref:MarR family winged helix-turn-helix transcriptional regulator n=1 Tax=Croceibacter atlanticus TaxID=313588 RepID=UPI002E15EE05|nr:MarR family transcriptional regulator [Croceibacter atlanticus]